MHATPTFSYQLQFVTNVVTIFTSVINKAIVNDISVILERFSLIIVDFCFYLFVCLYLTLKFPKLLQERTIQQIHSRPSFLRIVLK